MKKSIIYTAVIAVLITITMSFVIDKETEKKEEINWITFEEALKLNKKKPKKIMIDVYTDWCHWCKVMDKSTFKDEDVVKYINKNYYAVKFNAEEKGTVTYKNKEYTHNQLARSGFRVSGYPSSVFLDGNNDYATLAPGYWKPEDYRTLLQFIYEDHYKTTEWELYKAEQQGTE